MKVIRYPLKVFSPTYTLFWLLLLALPGISLAQNLAQDFVALHSGDTLYGTVRYINDGGVSTKFYKKIRWKDAQGKSKKISPKNIRAFRVQGDVFESFYLSQSSRKITLVNPRYDINPKRGQHHFLKLVQKGRLSHYQLEWIEQGESAVFAMDLFKKDSDTFFIRATQGLFGIKTKVLTSYFADCTTLATQIEDKQINSLQEILNFYNSNCD